MEARRCFRIAFNFTTASAGAKEIKKSDRKIPG
jgi:hypothetical protein